MRDLVLELVSHGRPAALSLIDFEGSVIGPLAGEGTVGIEPGVAPRDQPKIDSGDETVLENLDQVVDNEVCTEKMKSLKDFMRKPIFYIKVTIAFNYFGMALVQRMPRCRRGYINVVNNDFTPNLC
ncbi:hypothetical protein C1H46_039781 [Malus baccata]|uniref:Uncharacterized protein n=1 Tax=Malus baccata TaxID=106549 RepID=A0A540KKD9_MALBA|nr:hypothetical protein C1H46_039781 [Malus baccata]